MRLSSLLLGFVTFISPWVCEGQTSPPGTTRSASSTLEKALAYLTREVPSWSRDNKCFSCHNNGDAARALYLARRQGLEVPQEALADTTEWVSQPQDWDSNPGEPGFSDKKLARIQFAASLVAAFDAGLVREREVLVEAAEMLAADQQPDGSWQVDRGEALGSPATYGTPLATYMASRTLAAADRARFKGPLAWARRRLLNLPLKSVLDASSVALAFEAPAAEATPPDEASGEKVKLRESLDLIARSQTRDGGWGPYPGSPPEPFDTAVALLALASLREPGIADTSRIEQLIEGGRAYLAVTQLEPGGWPETTRPPGYTSYAQHVSTSGWATLALLTTR